MRIFNALFAIIFLFSAIVQYNDPDPLLWMVIYGYGALVCLLAILGKDNKILHYAGILIFLAYALYLFFVPKGVLSWLTEHAAENITGSMSDEKPWVEYTREFFGLLILSFALFINLIFRKNINKQKLKVTQ
ncbi:transmembrane 220 family protein [Salinimicrobium sp. TH3]|uniref:transmembrane 220 family protein n=1 Tax=Salinimicrobium sp. TH3 TaxID=2997342 RepID=UPI0022763DC5|nr:transmembrane 220 family protein [Salinimicrobium sp. TH3]MCY2685671.1 transmembrane 220 family protein [Salinimicrobium sp. TH3]